MSVCLYGNPFKTFFAVLQSLLELVYESLKEELNGTFRFLKKKNDFSL